jgi:hypothetical protein
MIMSAVNPPTAAKNTTLRPLPPYEVRHQRRCFGAHAGYHCSKKKKKR